MSWRTFATGDNPEFTISYNSSDIKSCYELKKRYQVHKTIGHGGQASVKEAIDMEMDDTVAMKVFRKKNMNLFALNAAYFEHTSTKNLDHENIIKTKGFFEDADFIIIFYELLSSDLRSLLVELDA